VKIPTLLQALDVVKQENPGLLKQLKPGQLLQARVAAATQNGIAKLLIGRNELTARTQIPLQQGEKLQLRVEKGLPQPELRVVRNDIQKPARALMLNAMSRQLTPATVQQSLRQLPAQSLLRNETAQQVLRVLLPSAPTPQQLTPAGVKSAMRNSGIFFEPLLSRGEANPKDQKLQLLQLLRLFSPQSRPAQGAGGTEQAPQQNDPKQAVSEQLMNRLLRLVEGSISRIQSQQASTLMNEEPTRQVWQFDMPVQLAEKLDQLHIRIQSDKDEEAEEDPSARVWKVDIDFDFDNLGSIFSRINLRGEQLSASFWSQRESTATLIERNIPKLESSLIDAGLEKILISSLTGKPPRTELALDNLLDERA